MKILVGEMPEHECNCLFHNSCTDFCELSKPVYYQGEHDCAGIENCLNLVHKQMEALSKREHIVFDEC